MNSKADVNTAGGLAQFARDVGPLVKSLYAHSNTIAQGEREAFL